MFYKDKEAVYRRLTDDPDGVWMISYTKPAAPFFVTKTTLAMYEKTETPEEYLQNAARADEELSMAYQERMRYIEPLLNDETLIRSKQQRLITVKKLSAETGVSVRRILSLYYRYLATHTVISERAVPDDVECKNSLFEKYLRKYYFTAKKMSLRMTYDLMVLEEYTDDAGTIMEDAPAFPGWKLSMVGSRQRYLMIFISRAMKTLSVKLPIT